MEINEESQHLGKSSLERFPRHRSMPFDEKNFLIVFITFEVENILARSSSSSNSSCREVD